MYNYLEIMVKDVKEAIKEKPEITADDLIYSKSSLSEKLYDELWICDSVTGNASGSYTFNRWEAREYVTDNMDLLKDACEEFCCMDELGEKFIDEEWEWMDVTIRCYLLSQAINEALEELETELEELEEMQN